MAAVAALHVALIDRVAQVLAPLGGEPMPPRIEVAWVREMQPAEPPRAAAAPAPVARRRAPRAAVPAGAASVAPAPASIPAPVPTSAAEAPPASAIEEPASMAEAAVPAPAVAAAAPDAPPFEWPESTRIRYTLTGQVRGEVHGQAQVEWIRAGPRYQVHLDIVVGLPIAPLFTRRMSSDGELAPEGLRPLFYDEETTIAFREPRRATLRFDPGAVWLSNGRLAAAPGAVQDSASQFVQLAYLFALRPDLLEPGRRVEVALALPRHVSTWVYRVEGLETVHTDFGAIDAFHLQPQPGAAQPGDLMAELWVAPSLRYLPVRLRIRQDEAAWLDLRMQGLPDLGLPPEPPTGPSSAAALR